MADLTRIYSGFAPRGRYQLPDGTHLEFERGQPVIVTPDQAAALDKSDEWSAPEPTSKPNPKGSAPDPKES